MQISTYRWTQLVRPIKESVSAENDLFQRFFIDNASACSVDHDCTFFHFGNRRCVEQVMGFLREWYVHAYHIGVGDQRVK